MAADLEMVRPLSVPGVLHVMLAVTPDPVARCRAHMQLVSTSLIILNTAYLGVSMHVSMSLRWRSQKRPQWLSYGDIAFLFAFAMELMVRMALGKVEFFRGRKILWNALDLITTVLLFLEVAIDIDIGSRGAY